MAFSQYSITPKLTDSTKFLKMHTASPVESSKGGPRSGILQGERIPCSQWQQSEDPVYTRLQGTSKARGMVQMKYRAVPHGDRRHLIVDERLDGTEQKVTANLADNEFKIELLVAKDCPIRRSCVRIEEEINSICDHAGPFPLTERAQVDFGRITCLQGDHTRVLYVTELWVEGCPLGKNCAECENRLLLFIPSAPQPEKSHGYVKCARPRSTWLKGDGQ